jgi:hypothetical protein
MTPTLRLRIVAALLMSFIMSSLMTGWVSWLNFGFQPEIYARWLRAFVTAWPASFLIAVTFSPFVQRFAQRLLG